MEPYGGFDHNEQSFRVVTQIEERYPLFDGLNLTWETLEGLAKHNGPVQNPRPAIAAFDADWSLELQGYASAEAQVASLSDDIAYVNHDLDDGLRAGLFTLSECRELPLVGEVIAQVERRYPDLDEARRAHAAVRADRSDGGRPLIESRRRLQEAAPGSVDEVRAAGQPLIAFSAAMKEKLAPRATVSVRSNVSTLSGQSPTSKARRVLRQLFDIFLEEPGLLPDEWRQRVQGANGAQRARIVADYIAGMTDRYALESHEKLFNPYVRL